MDNKKRASNNKKALLVAVALFVAGIIATAIAAGVTALSGLAVVAPVLMIGGSIAVLVISAGAYVGLRLYLNSKSAGEAPAEEMTLLDEIRKNREEG